MPAPRPNRRDNPLRKLRLILGEGETPMHQELFAARIGVPVATVRSIEAGHRPMTKENCLEQIFCLLFAAWNPDDQQWHLFDLRSKILYEKKHALLVKEFDPQDPYLDCLALHELLERVLDLFDATDRAQRMSLLFYLNQHLAQTAEGFGLAKKVTLARTEPTWMLTTEPNIRGKKLSKPILRPDYPSRRPSPSPTEIFDFRSRRTFDPADYPATPEEVDAQVQASKADRRQRQQKDFGPIPDQNEAKPKFAARTESIKSPPISSQT